MGRPELIMKRRRRYPNRLSLSLGVYAAIFYSVLYGPLIMIAVLSLNRSNIIGFPIRGWG
jgi:ABC-type spermidine/putrescine transport system permease subunit II